MQWPWSNLRDCTLVNQSESPELVNKFLQTITYDFIADLIKEIDTALKDDRPMIHTFNIFLSSEAAALIDRNKQLVILNNHYWNDVSDTYQSKSTFAGKLIDPIAQKIESKGFLSKVEDLHMYLLDRVKSDAKKNFSREYLTKNPCISISTKISHHLVMSIHTCALSDVWSNFQKV